MHLSIFLNLRCKHFKYSFSCCCPVNKIFSFHSYFGCFNKTFVVQPNSFLNQTGLYILKHSFVVLTSFHFLSSIHIYFCIFIFEIKFITSESINNKKPGVSGIGFPEELKNWKWGKIYECNTRIHEIWRTNRADGKWIQRERFTRN